MGDIGRPDEIEEEEIVPLPKPEEAPVTEPEIVPAEPVKVPA